MLSSAYGHEGRNGNILPRESRSSRT